MSPARDAIIAWIGAVIGFVVAASAALREEFGPAALIAVGAAFLIYWGFRVDREAR